MRQSCIMFVLLALVAGLAGCSESEPGSDPRDSALKDPMNYNPAAEDKYDVSGGGILEMDKKALRKDMDHVLSP